MATYDSYKDSGVKWLGQIPSHWEVKKLRAFFDRRNHKVSDKDYAPLSVTKNGIVPQMENVAKSKDSDNRRLVRVGDFVINSRSDRKGSSGVSSLEGSVSFVNTIMIPRDNVISSYCNYLLKSIAFVEENYRNGHGIVADLWTTSFDEQKLIKLAMPPLCEQEAIVSYLDKVTADIDKAIEAQQKMIDALNERKQIIITRAVTRGLNPDAPLKDSGIDWLGQIPEHWEIVPLKSRCKFGQSLNITKADLTEDGYPVVSYGQIHSKLNSRTSLTDELIRFVPEVYATKYPNCICHKGDFLVADTSEDLLGCGNVVYIDQDADILAGYHTYSLKNVSIGNPKFLAYLLASDIWRFQIRSLVNAVKVYTISKSIIKQSLIWFPSKKEQDAIVDSLDVAISKIDDMLKVSRNTISLLQERKQIIINEVVTGKKKVI